MLLNGHIDIVTTERRKRQKSENEVYRYLIVRVTPRRRRLK